VSDASTEFAKRVTALNGLAQQILAAKSAGNTATVERLRGEFKRLLAGSDLPALIAQAREAELPSPFLLKLAEAGETFARALRWVPVIAGVLLVVVGVIAVRRYWK
jgi:hypothetical protein